MSLAKKGLVALPLLLLFGWLSLSLMLAAFQRMLVFPAPDVAVDVLDAEAARVGATPLAIDTEDGESLYGWVLPGRADQPLVVYFNGNGSTVAGVPTHLRLLQDAGVGMLHVNYRGYPGSTGTPSEVGLRADARAVWQHAIGLRPARDIVLMGTSLGGGVATLLAAEVSRVGTPPRALVVESSFTSVTDVARGLYPFLPVRTLLQHRFDSHAAAPDVTCPVLLLHGDHDQLIDLSHARTMAERHHDATLVVVPGGVHSDAMLRDAAAWQAFVRVAGLRPASG
ncbi:MAG: alpha/beta hydrolase [Alphaproteobacteria bacterium]|nr:alpha/beta hydrolase [Alphaproteobacteria bacterium]